MLNSYSYGTTDTGTRQVASGARLAAFDARLTGVHVGTGQAAFGTRLAAFDTGLARVHIGTRQAWVIEGVC